MSKDFRKAYYSQLGMQAVEVKNSLDTILQEEVIGKDSSRLSSSSSTRTNKVP